MVFLKDIYFGDVEGKDEAKELKDGFVSTFYSGNNYFDEMKERKKFIIVGRKGTGKSLLAQYYKTQIESEKHAVEILDESDFMLKKLENFNYQNIEEQEMIIFWEYFFLLKVSELLISKTTKMKKIFFRRFKKLNKIVSNSNYKMDSYSTTSKRGVNGKGSKNVGEITSLLSQLDASLEKSITQNYTPSEYYNHVKKLKEIILNCLKISKINLSIIFDDLDELEVFVESEESKKTFIHTMIKSVKKLNEYFSDNDFEVKLFLLLRKDMANDLNRSKNNINKILKTNTIDLKWNYNPKISVLKQPLAQMIIYKIRASSVEFDKMSDQEVYNSIMPYKVSGQDAIKFMIDNSFGRPRDFVMFLNAVKENFKEKSKINSNYMTNSMSDYSRDFFSELENEIVRNQNKDLLNNIILLIKDNQMMSFTLADLYKKYDNNKSRYEHIRDFNDIDSGIKELYIYSVVGTVTQHDNGITVLQNGEIKQNYKKVFEFYYRDNPIDNPDLSNYICVHFALRSALNLIVNTNKKKKVS